MKILSDNLRKIRKANKLTLKNIADLFGVQPAAINKWEKGTSNPSVEQLTILAEKYGVSLQDLLEDKNGEDYHHKIRYPEDLEFIDLPFVSVPARATFIELPDGIVGTLSETYTIIKRADTNYEGQILIEVDGDSMEPMYPTGSVVRCKRVCPNDWQYITGGVYVLVFNNTFVIKRIRDNNYHEGFITLHSDNIETGGKINVKVDDLRQVWKVLRIVDAPAR